MRRRGYLYYSECFPIYAHCILLPHSLSPQSQYNSTSSKDYPTAKAYGNGAVILIVVTIVYTLILGCVIMGLSIWGHYNPDNDFCQYYYYYHYQDHKFTYCKYIEGGFQTHQRNCWVLVYIPYHSLCTDVSLKVAFLWFLVDSGISGEIRSAEFVLIQRVAMHC